jgi:crotonobetainyl-CoA:carnitine CoA-transferase CaiB-like acyl-CoA transferase
MPATDAYQVPETSVPTAGLSDELTPLAGVKVVEIGRFAAGPSCATVLADWGADVVKIEPPEGDPARGPGSIGSATTAPVNPRFEVHNRSRRSLVVDLRLPAGRTVADRLLEASDVLVTNLSPGALERLELDAASLRARHPRLIAAQISGYDQATPEASNRSYDHGAYWSYSGVASLFESADGEPPQPTGGFGDRAAGSMLAGAITAALFARERTGLGSHVSTSLVNTAMWLMASDVSDILTTGRNHRSPDRRRASVPTVNCFRTADARWLWLQVMVPEKDWQLLIAALDARWLDEDPRFRGGDVNRLRANQAAFVELLDELFRARPLAEWHSRLAAYGITWAPVRNLEEAVGDAGVRASSAFVNVIDEHGAHHVSVNTPCSFEGLAVRPATRAPHVGENTDEVLASLGVSSDEIDTLRRSGVLGRTEPLIASKRQRPRAGATGVKGSG